MPSFSDAGFVELENRLHRPLVRHSILVLRLAVGAVFLGFGVLKLFPDVSPAQGLAIKTIDLLSFGLVPWEVGIVAIATLECFIGICFLLGRWMRLAIWLLALQLVGVLAPIALLTGRLFSGPHHAPTLEGQYAIKDIVLVAAGMVIAAGSFRGGRLVRDDPRAEPADAVEGGRGARSVLSAANGEAAAQGIRQTHATSHSTHHGCRAAAVPAAMRASEKHTPGVQTDERPDR